MPGCRVSPGCARGNVSRSSRVTSSPARAHSIAAAQPPGPPPKMMTPLLFACFTEKHAAVLRVGEQRDLLRYLYSSLTELSARYEWCAAVLKHFKAIGVARQRHLRLLLCLL